MKFTIKKVYKLANERNISARKPLIYNGNLYVIFIYDKKGFVESRIQCLDTENLELKWEYIHAHVLNNLEVTGDGKLLCSCMDGYVKCFDALSGSEKWTFKTEESNIGAISNILNDRIIFGGVQAGAKSTWCLDINNGNVIWKKANKGHMYIPLLSANNGFFCIGNEITSVSLENGAIDWQKNEPNSYIFNPKRFDDFIVVCGRGKINFYDIHKGDLKLSIETRNGDSIAQIIFDEKNNMYFGDAGGYFYRYSLSIKKEKTGGKNLSFRQEWSYRVEDGASIESIPVVDKDSVYFIADSKELIAMMTEVNRVKWEFKTKAKAGISGVTIDDDNIYTACGGFVYKLRV